LFTIDLSGNDIGIEKIEGKMEDITQLNSLYLDSIDINDNDLSVFQEFSNLTTLSLQGNGLEDVSLLSEISSLESLYLCRNNINNLEPIAQLDDLNRLYLSENNLIDIEEIGNLKKLQWLDLGYNHIEEITPISGLSELEYLYLDGSNINDITPLSNIKPLRNLFLSDNNITSINAITETNHLRHLYIENNYLDISPGSETLNIIKNLEEKGVEVSYEPQDEDPSPQYELTVKVEGQGEVTPEPGEHSYVEDTQVNLKAVPDPGWEFKEWKGDDVKEERSKETTVLMGENKTVVAVFKEDEDKDVNLNIEVEGEGVVEPEPGKHTYDKGEEVTLSAITVMEGWEFKKWEGNVEDPEEPETTIILSEDEEVTAVFEHTLVDEVQEYVEAKYEGTITAGSETGNLVEGEESELVKHPVTGGENVVFALNWEGSEVKLSVYNPEGELYDEIKSSEPPVSIKVSEAEAGEWSYKVKARSVDEDILSYAAMTGVTGLAPPENALVFLDIHDGEVEGAVGFTMDYLFEYENASAKMNNYMIDEGMDELFYQIPGVADDEWQGIYERDMSHYNIVKLIGQQETIDYYDYVEGSMEESTWEIIVK